MLINLLDNVLRYTPSGGTVTVCIEEAGNKVVIAVKDTGPGIAPEHLPHLFERFFRAESARDRESGGVGLGLPIVKEIAEAHGGTVRVESEVGKGAVFIITLPAAEGLFLQEDLSPSRCPLSRARTQVHGGSVEFRRFYQKLSRDIAAVS